jgi:hypothetical protein
VSDLGHDGIAEGAEALRSLSALEGGSRRLFGGLLLVSSDGPSVRVQPTGKPMRHSTQSAFSRPGISIDSITCFPIARRRAIAGESAVPRSR